MDTITIASDHAGFELKQALVEYLANNYQVSDLGCNNTESVDYPLFAQDLAKEVLTKNNRGILICGSGIGMDIAANRFKGIRAALCYEEELAEMSRKHNDANVLVLAGRFTPKDKAIKILETWLNTEFLGDRHQRRVDQLDNS